MNRNNIHVLKSIPHSYNGRNFEIVIFQDMGDLDTIYVEPLENGQQVPITFPDGHQVTRVYSVDFLTRMSMASDPTSINAVDNLVQTAIQDLEASL